MTLSPGAKIQPKRWILPSPAGFRAACSSRFSERAPTPPRFIGHSTWMSRIGSRPKQWGMRAPTSSIMLTTAVSGFSAGLAVAGQGLNGPETCPEPDGAEIVDIDVFPDEAI